MDQTPCPFCKEDIDIDSIFCDQCGKELMKCSECGNFCKGNFCPKCGKPSVKASQLSSVKADAPKASDAPAQSVQPVQPAQPSQPLQSSSQSPQQPEPQYVSPTPGGVSYSPRPTTLPDNTPGTGTSIPGASEQPTRMVCRELGITLPLQSGAIIGRVTGNYVHLLTSCQYISGTHARIDFNGGWTITDLNSRNGTDVNGVPCIGAPVAIGKGSVIRLARTYNFVVE